MIDSFLTLVGNLTGDPALGRTQAGTPVCRFRIAANERIFDRSAGQWRDGPVLYLPVICWRGLAENVAASLCRGDPVTVVGRLRQRHGDQERGPQTEVAAEIVAADLSRRAVRFLPTGPRIRDLAPGSTAGPAAPPVPTPAAGEVVGVEAGDTNPSGDTGDSDSGHADSGHADSGHADSGHPDSGHPDSGHPDSGDGHPEDGHPGHEHPGEQATPPSAAA